MQNEKSNLFKNIQKSFQLKKKISKNIYDNIKKKIIINNTNNLKILNINSNSKKKNTNFPKLELNMQLIEDIEEKPSLYTNKRFNFRKESPVHILKNDRTQITKESPEKRRKSNTFRSSIKIDSIALINEHKNKKYKLKQDLSLAFEGNKNKNLNSTNNHIKTNTTSFHQRYHTQTVNLNITNESKERKAKPLKMYKIGFNPKPKLTQTPMNAMNISTPTKIVQNFNFTNCYISTMNELRSRFENNIK